MTWKALRPSSLRAQLLVGILLPVAVLVAMNTYSLYREALASANLAYDRTLLASAKTISEQLDVIGFDEAARFAGKVPYAALEAFETDNQSRLYYRVSTLDGQLVSGYEDLPLWKGQVPSRPAYAALVDFYDGQFRGDAVRVAALVQPVASPTGRGIALVQVAETTELRQARARGILVNTLWRQGGLLLVIGVVVVLVVQRATRPVRGLSDELAGRPANDLKPLGDRDMPTELQPLTRSLDQLMLRLTQLLEHQRRFVRDTSHQLRTPLAVLKVQVQSALRGDQPPAESLQEIEHTVDRATRMANQMLALAKLEQIRDDALGAPNWLDECVREVALDLAALMADQEIEFAIETEPALVRAHEWMLNELTRNLLHNAIKHTPRSGQLRVSVMTEGQEAVLCIRNEGVMLSEAMQRRLFEPFAATGQQQGAGLGLAICQQIVEALDGRILLVNCASTADWREGVEAIVRLPLEQSTP